MRPDYMSGASSFYQVIDFNCGPILTFIVTYIISDSFAIHEPNLPRGFVSHLILFVPLIFIIPIQ